MKRVIWMTFSENKHFYREHVHLYIRMRTQSMTNLNSKMKQKRSRPNMLRKFFRRFDDFCVETSLPGFRYMHSAHKPQFRIIWALMLSVFTILTVQQLMDRVLFYAFNPFVISLEERQMDSVNMPSAILCNTMQHRLSYASINPLFLFGDLLSFNESAVEFIEFRAKLQDSNGVINQTILQLLSDFPSISKQLRRTTSTNADKLSSSILSGPTKDQKLSEKLREFSSRIHNILPITYSLLNAHNISTRNPFPIDKPLPLGSIPDPEMLSWISTVNHHQLMLHQTNPKCFSDWRCRFNKAADILDDIYRMDLMIFHQMSHQTAEEFIVSCFWKGNRSCSITEVKLMGHGQCFKVAPSVHSTIKVPGLTNSLQIVLNSEKYEMFPSTQNPTAVLYLQPSELDLEQDQFQAKQSITLESGVLYDIAISGLEKLERYDTTCGEKRLKFFKSYSDDACHWEHKSMAAIRKCGCIPMHSAASQYDLQQMNIKIKKCSFLQEYTCQHMLSNHEVESEDCPKKCSSTKFDVDVTSNKLKQEMLDKHIQPDWIVKQKAMLKRYMASSPLIRAHHFFYRRQLQQFSYDLFTELYPLVHTSLHIHHACFPHSREKHFTVLHSIAGIDLKVAAQLVKTLKLDLNIYALEMYEGIDKALWEGTVTLLSTVFGGGLGDILGQAAYSGGKGKLYGNLGNFITESDFATYFRPSGLIDIKQIWQQFAEFFQMNRTKSINEAVKFEKIKSIYKMFDVIVETMGPKFIDDLFPHRNLSSLKKSKNPLDDLPDIKKRIAKTIDYSHQIMSVAFQMQKTNFAQPDWFSHFLLLTEELESFLAGAYYDRTNLVMAQIYFRDFQEQTVSQSLSYTGWGLMADIGGTLGFYLGARLITFIEIILFVVQLKIARKPVPVQQAKPRIEGRGPQNNNQSPQSCTNTNGTSDLNSSEATYHPHQLNMEVDAEKQTTKAPQTKNLKLTHRSRKR